jgi:hypothetical protein
MSSHPAHDHDHDERGQEVNPDMATTPGIPDQIRQVLTALAQDAGLEVIFDEGEHVILANPARPGRGTVLVRLTDGQVTWCRHRYERFGCLEGIPASGSAVRSVPAAMIVHLLTAATVTAAELT